MVIGAGIMGEGIVQSFAQGGLSVRLVDLNEEILGKSLKQIDNNINLFKEFGLLKEEPSVISKRIKTFILENLTEAVKESDFIVEAIPEVLQLKRELFAKLDFLPKEVIMGSNTSSLTISNITEEMSTPERVVGLHYFNPAHIMPLVEIHRGNLTTDEVVEVTREFISSIGKKPILVRKEVPGFVVNRIQAAMARESHYLIEQGVVTPEDLDMASKASYGFRLANLGSLETADMGGLDTIYRACDNIFKHLNNSTRPSSLLKKIVERGDLGVKTGKGWHDYSGQTKSDLIKKRDRILLKQLKLFNENMQE